jgi:hypothetical protein
MDYIGQSDDSCFKMRSSADNSEHSHWSLTSRAGKWTFYVNIYIYQSALQWLGANFSHKLPLPLLSQLMKSWVHASPPSLMDFGRGTMRWFQSRPKTGRDKSTQSSGNILQKPISLTGLDWFLCYLMTLFQMHRLYGVQGNGKATIYL